MRYSCTLHLYLTSTVCPRKKGSVKGKNASVSHRATGSQGEHAMAIRLLRIDNSERLVNRNSVFLHQTSRERHPFVRHFSATRSNETPRVLVASWEYICPPRSRPNFTSISLAQHVPSKDLPDRWTESATGRRHLAGFGIACRDGRRGRPFQLQETVSEVLIEMIFTGGTETLCAAASII
jgi:hypothetical protein